MKPYFIRANIIGLSLILTYNICFSQALTRQNIDSAFRKIDASFKQKRGVMYILNGVPFDSLQLDTALSKYDRKYLIELNFITCEKANLFHCYNDIALILFAHNQRSKTKRKVWKAAKKALTDTIILLIDNTIIDQAKSKQIFKALRLRDIMYIDTTNKSNKQLIRIWKAS